MHLVIDIGNTNIVFAIYNNSVKLHTWRMRSKSESSSDEYAVFLFTKLAMAKIVFSDIKLTILASVVPKALYNIKKFLVDSIDSPIYEVGKPPLDTFIKLNIDDPKQAGADRIVNAWSCYNTYQGNYIIVDFGTATTFDVIDAGGVYQGGVIAPGANISLKALVNSTAQLYPIEIIATPVIIGKSSLQAQQSGMFWGYHGLINGICNKINEEHIKNNSTRLNILATGGLSSLFKDCNLFDIIDEDLTIRGLSELVKIL